MSDQVTITLTKDQSKGIEQLRETIIGWRNKTEFLSEVADQQFDNGHEFSSPSWAGLSLILKNLCGSGWQEVELLDNLIEQISEKTKATA